MHLDNMSESRIAHLDMDAFFAAVEQRDDPLLRGKPVVVGGLGARGVVATASYEARTFGIHSAMSTAHARRLCPGGVFLAPQFDKYRRVSGRVMGILRSVSSSIEPISLDEAFFDLSASASTLDDAAQIASDVKRHVWRETRLSCSVGVAPNRFLAKLGSELDKPDGFKVIHPDEVDSVLAPLGVGQLWGVGRVTERRLCSMGLRTVADLRTVPSALLDREFGQMGRVLYRLARGQDPTPIRTRRDSRSISREITYPLDLKDPIEMEASLRGMAHEVGVQLAEQHLAARTVRIKVRFPDFRTETRQIGLAVPTSSPHLIGELAVHLLHERAEVGNHGVRLLGVGVSRLSAASVRQLSLFDDVDGGAQDGLGASFR
ncbi:DNA polymerase IV [Candidatus Bipolaricaulota bacterium]|nr:DNA polymerase IV [Candidatus Bipolaricaulota bacterium]